MKNPESCGEEELVRLLAAQNLAAYSSLYNNYSAALYGFIFRIVKNKETAEDLLQDVFIKILANIDQYDRSKGRLFTWMSTISKNTAIDSLRTKAAQYQRKTDCQEFINDMVSKEYSGSYDLIGIRNHILWLRPKYQLIIELAYFYGYSQPEISKMLDIPLGTVKTRMRTAVSELRKLLLPELKRA